MRLLSFAALVGLTSAVVLPRSFEVPSTDGFPHPDTAQKADIAKLAGGKLPDSPPPTSLGDASITTFQLIAFNELFECAFFDSLIVNITRAVKGWEMKNADRVLTILKAVLAQEETHALAALGNLNAVGAFAPSPCRYQFPSDSLVEAVSLAETFTSVVLGALQNANTNFAKDGEPGAVQTVSAVIGNEAEQQGWYRLMLGRVPNEAPFLTHVPAPFAFSALQAFVVPDSCDFPLSNINITIFPPLVVNDAVPAIISPRDQTLRFSADLDGYDPAKQYYGGDGKGLWLTYTSGQLLPFSEPLEDVKWDGNKISFKANFPFTENVMQGFSHAALTTTDTFASADDVPASTLAAPGLIQVNDLLGPDW